LLLVPLSVLLLAFSLAACGGGDSDEDEITDVIETAVTSTDPADCTRLATQSFLEQAEFERGEAAVESCEESAEDTSDDPESVEVSAVEVDGGSATAAVAFEGSSFDGQTLNLSLLDEDGQWKLDRIESFESFDQRAFADAFEATAVEGDDPLTPEQAACVAENFREGPSETVQEALLSGNPEQLAPAFAGCDLGA
jgi:hypothetical protein